MNSFRYFVLYLTITTYQAQCKKSQKTGKSHLFRRPFDQTNLMSTVPAQQSISRFIDPAMEPVVNYELYKDEKREPEAKLTKLLVKVEHDGQSISTVPVMDHKGKHLKRNPKEFNEAKKRAVMERFRQKDKMEILDIERKMVEEMKQNVERLRKESRAERSKKKNHNTVKYNEEVSPVLRSNVGGGAGKSTEHQKTKKSTTTEKSESRFSVEMKPEKGSSASGSSPKKKKKSLDTSSDSDDNPVMRGVNREDGDDEDLYFDLDGEFLSHVV